MRLNCCKTLQGLVPCEECDYEEFKTLVNGREYPVEVKTTRNLEFHKKYMKFFRVAWECLPESHCEFLKNNLDGFRKTVEIAAGYYEPVYNLERREWQQIPKSIAFDKLEQQEFEKLYERVKDIVFKVFLTRLTEEEFYEKLGNF